MDFFEHEFPNVAIGVYVCISNVRVSVCVVYEYVQLIDYKIIFKFQIQTEKSLEKFKTI